MAATSKTRSKRATTTHREASSPRHDTTSIIDALPLACAIFAEADGALVAANRLFREAFGALSDFARRDLFDAQFESFDPADSATRNDGREVFHAKTRRWYELTWSPARHSGIDCDVVSAIDITERQQALSAHKTQHERLLFTSRSMSVGEMATTLAHELNQPLAAIVNYLSVGLRLLGRDGADADRLADALRHARGQAEHASQVIARLREFVRAREPRRENQIPAELVATVLRLLALEAEKHRVSIDVDIPADLPGVYADRVMIEQVLLNLMKNGIEAMRAAEPRQRRLDVRASRNLDDQIEFRIGDRGCGLSDSAAEQVFTPFFTTKADGMGIGLAICRSIIEYHQGRLYFERNPAGGSVFVFTLPPTRR
jgi:C4-dicarboxylate-specific signal transduction histidine kinase